MDDLAALVKDLEGSPRGDGWTRLFFDIDAREGEEPPTTIGQLPKNLHKNRYINVFPMDETRVILNNPENDYINANHIKVDGIEQRYILTQGPVKYSCADFWQMVWEQRAPGIVMLNQLRELYQGEMYWPGDDVGAKVRHGSFDVTLKSIGKEKVYTRREFELRNVESNASRSIVHLHLTKWPDYGVPRSPDEFVLFWAEVRKLGILDSKDGPGIIHCTGGVGRSGTFCFVDVILRKFKKTGSVKVSDLPDTLLQLRKQRCWLIQTPEQLRLAYLAILSGVEIVMSGK